MGRGVYLINNIESLSDYLSICNYPSVSRASSQQLSNSSLSTSPAYIQEYCPHDRDIRVIVIGNQIALAYWRIAQPKDFRSNISCGGDISFAPVPEKALKLALHTATICGWDDVGLDLVEHKGEFLVVEANMKYGRKGFTKAGIDYNLLLQKLIETGEI